MTRCPDCGAADAYIGLTNVECVNSSCARYSKKWAFTARKGDSSLWTPPEVKTHQTGGLMPYREPAKQLPSVKARCGPGHYLCWKYDRDLCDVCAGRGRDAEREYASEKGVLRPVAPKVITSGTSAFGPFGELRPIPDHPSKFWNHRENREVDFRNARDGEYYDQIALGGEGGVGGVVVGSHYEFFRDLSGKHVVGGTGKPPLSSNLVLQCRLCHGEEAIFKSASIRLIDGESGDPVSQATADWLGMNTFLRFDINSLLCVEGLLYRFYDGGVGLPQLPFVTSDNEIRANLRVGRRKHDLPSTIVSFSIGAWIKSATTRW